MATLSEIIAEQYQVEQTKKLQENREILSRQPPRTSGPSGVATGGTMDPQATEWSPEQRQRFKEGLDQQIRNEDLMEDVSPAMRPGVGFWSGAKRIRDGALNAIGMMGDEEVLHNRMLDADISASTPGSYGQFGGEMWATAPAATIGNLTRRIHAASKAHNLAQRNPGFMSKRVEGFSTPGMSAAYDSALAGAVAADPNERGRGAALAGTGGGLLNKAIEGVGRVFRRGLAEKSPSMQSLDETTKRELGSEGFVPLTQATGGVGDSITAATKSSMDAVSMMPKARTAMEHQSRKALDDMYELAIHRAFNAGPKRDFALKTFKMTGDMQFTMDAVASHFPGKKGVTVKVIEEAGKNKKRGLFEPTHLIKSAEKEALERGKPKSSAEMRKLANEFSDVLEDQSVGTSNVESRMLYHQASRKAQGLMGGLGATVDKIPLIGPALGSEALQSFLLGSTDWQKFLRRKMSTKGGKAIDETIDAVRRTTAAQPVTSDEASDFITVQDMTQNALRRAKEQADALRGK